MKSFVNKYFIPNEENEYVPHIMRKASVGVLAFLALLIFFVGILHVTVIQKTSLLSAVIPKSLVELANNNRINNRLSTLTTNPLLEAAAQKKANDMASKGYFAHTSPEGKTPWYWLKEVQYDFQAAGENLAINFVDSTDVDSAWMNSPGHRANILNGKFTEIGIATAKGYYNGRETIFVVQMFGKPLRNTPTRLVQDVLTTTQVNAETSTTAPSTSLKPTSKPIVATTSTTSSPIITKPTRVLGETETYIEAENIQNESSAVIAQEEVLQGEEGSFALGMLASPKKAVSSVYLLLGGFVLLALALMIGIELRKQHPKHIGLGVFLIVLICLLAYVFRTVLFPEVVVL